MPNAPRSPPAQSRVADALRALEEANLRRTPQRVAIVRAFSDDPTHPTAQTIFDRLRRTMPAMRTMSFATVYNTLAALEAANRCRTIRVDGPAGDGSARFDPNVEPHDHAVCDRCGSVRDVEAPGEPGEEPGPLRLHSGFHVRAVERVYRGECAECRAARASGEG